MNTTTRVILAALAVIAIPVVFYLLAAFTLWETDPAKWNGEARFFVAWFGMLFGVCAAALTLLVGS